MLVTLTVQFVMKKKFMKKFIEEMFIQQLQMIWKNWIRKSCSYYYLKNNKEGAQHQANGQIKGCFETFHCRQKIRPRKHVELEKLVLIQNPSWIILISIVSSMLPNMMKFVLILFASIHQLYILLLRLQSLRVLLIWQVLKQLEGGLSWLYGNICVTIFIRLKDSLIVKVQ